MHDVVIFIMSSGPNVGLSGKANLTETVYSISKNIGDVDYKYYIVTDSRSQEKFAHELFSHESLKHVVKPESLLEVKYSEDSWAREFNLFFDNHKDNTKYVLFSHDDLIVKTPDFFTKTLEEIKDAKDPIGWISFTNDRYYKFDKNPVANSFKDPFCLDRHNDPRIYECHNFEPDEKVTEQNYDKLDFPNRAVKCHGPYAHLNLVSSEALEKIGPCVEWTDYTILIDNDWALESLKSGFFNVWIPDVLYTHPNPKYPRTPGTDLRFEREAHEKFYKKWGFPLWEMPLSDDVIVYIRQKFKDTNIPLSSYRNSYDWDYLKDE